MIFCLGFYIFNFMKWIDTERDCEDGCESPWVWGAAFAFAVAVEGAQHIGILPDNGIFSDNVEIIVSEPQDP